MLFRIVRPVKRSDSSNLQFTQRIPADVRSKASGRTLSIPVGDATITRAISANAEVIKLSLRTSNPREAKIRQAKVVTYLEAYWDSLRQGPAPLSHKQTIALAGQVFKRFTAALEDNPGSAELWLKVREENEKAIQGNFGIGSLLIDKTRRVQHSLEERFGPFVDVELAHESLVIDEESRERLLHKVAEAMNDAADRIHRFAEGDYAPAPYERRFPKLELSKTKPEARRSGGAGIRELFDGWWREAQATQSTKPSTHDSYKRTIEKFVTFLKHDDAARVAPEDVVRFKDYRLSQGVSARTVNGSDLSALKSIFGWGVMNRKVTSNPAEGITIKFKKKPQLRAKGFSDDEALAILSQSCMYKPGSREAAKMSAAKKWIPWLCAFTGARVGEMLQLRKMDIRQKDGFWIAHITPEAGTVKDDEPRNVVLHQQLIDLGFLELVSASKVGHLFVTPRKDGNVLKPIKTAQNRLREFVRKAVTDRHVNPNHGWRHRFKTVGLEEGIDARILDAIEGHAGKTVGDSYGDVTLKAQAAAMAKFPYYPVANPRT